MTYTTFHNISIVLLVVGIVGCCIGLVLVAVADNIRFKYWNVIHNGILICAGSIFIIFIGLLGVTYSHSIPNSIPEQMGYIQWMRFASDFASEYDSKCPNCGATMSSWYEYCPECGFKYDEFAKCPECGAEVSAADAFCPWCGTALELTSLTYEKEET